VRPRYASRSSMTRHHRVVTDGEGHQDTETRPARVVLAGRNTL
jgi:hypothetical protein